MGAARLPWTGVLVIVACCGGCASAPVTESVTTATTSPSPPAATAATQAATLDITSGCARATGYLVARQGELSVGPFEDDSPRPQASPEHKLWVASQRPGPDSATLVVTGPGGHTETQVRGLPNATASDAKQFWAGVIGTPADGDYRIEVSVGPDHLCVTATFHR